jgi:hypothetical protein
VEGTTGTGTGAEQRFTLNFTMGTAVRPGSYFVRLEADGHREVQRLVLLGPPSAHP